MKTTLDLPEDLVREVNVRAAQQGRSVHDLVAELLRQGLGAAPTGEGSAREGYLIDETGLPVICCRPDAITGRLDIDTLLGLEQTVCAEEDLHRAGLPR